MNENWNLLSVIVLAVAAFVVGHVSGRPSYNVIVILCGLFLLAVANGMADALKPKERK